MSIAILHKSVSYKLEWNDLERNIKVRIYHRKGLDVVFDLIKIAFLLSFKVKNANKTIKERIGEIRDP